jgi:hypothetical protein
MPLTRVTAAESLIWSASARSDRGARSATCCNTGAVKSFTASGTPNTATQTLATA